MQRPPLPPRPLLLALPVALVLALLACPIAGPAREAQAGPDERSPFDMVRWTDAGPQVQVGGGWYELVSVDGVPFARVVAACRKLDPRRWEKRFCEDLVAALAAVGHDLGDRVALVVRAPGSKEEQTLSGVPATNRKRDRIRDARPWKRAAAPVVKRVDRPHADQPSDAYAFLTIRHHGDARPRLSKVQAHADLDQLEWLVENVFSYRELRRPFDHRAAFDAVRFGIGENGIARMDFHIQLRKLIALFGDGHARVRGVYRALPRGFLPFVLAEADARIAAVDAEGKPIDPKHPYVVSIDGVPINTWLDTAARVNARGSPSFQGAHAFRVGAFAAFVRSELGKPAGGALMVTLKGADGRTTRTFDALADVPVRHHDPLPRSGGRLKGGIRHVRIRSMDSEPEFLIETMSTVLGSRSTRALLLDVRGNGGGSRLLLKALLPHLMPADAEPLVCNVAAYRLSPGEKYDERRGNLENRFLFPVSSPDWTDSERQAARQAATRVDAFEALLHHAPGFTPLHAMVVSPAAASKPRFLGPIAILVDRRCFSATDVFVGALEQLPNVTVIGTTTGGGSGRSRSYELAHSEFEVRLSSMASYRPNGMHYDMLGISPDVEVRPTLSDLSGETDTALEKAVAHLHAALKR